MCLPECLLFTDIVYAAPPKPKIKAKFKPQQVLQLTYVKVCPDNDTDAPIALSIAYLICVLSCL